MGKKLRVFQVARELNISNEAVIEFFGKKNKTIRNQMSAVSEELYTEICEKYKMETVAASDSGQDFRQQIKEKHALEEMRRNKARIELEERLKFATQLAEERPQRLKKADKLKQDVEKLEEEEKKKAAKKEEPVKEAVQEETVAEDEISVVEMISKAKKEIEKENKALGVEPEKKKADDKEATKAKTPEKADEKGKVDSKDSEKQEVTEGKKSDSNALAKKLKEGREDKEKQKGKGKKRKKRKVSEEEVQESIRQTLASMDETKSKRRKRRNKDSDLEFEDDEEIAVIEVNEFISVSELAQELEVEAGEVITKCLELGMMVSINQRLDMVTIEAVADEFGFSVEKKQEVGTEIIDKYGETESDLENAVTRHPVVTIMGHVDHGKTSLLDYVRKSSITTGEAGGITQHIGAYEVKMEGKSITFLDTPGHEAFTAMRARGAQATDLVVLIVAADDGVQPQTVEAISHALAANVPIVAAINKVDKPDANPEKIKQQLADKNILVEQWGGKYQSVEVSAKTGAGVDKLLELILLEAELLELKANSDRTALGIIIESELDKGKGPVGTVLVQNGTLKVGDLFVAGHHSGKVRAMYNELNKKMTKAPPSTPVQVIGFDGVPQAGDSFIVMKTEREVRDISTKRKQLRREQEFRSKRHLTLDEISLQIKYGEVKELNIILKADVDGSNEALSDALMKLSNNEVAVNVIHKAVGGISESDVLLAVASQAFIIGFHVRPSIQARELAKKEEVDIRLYDIIYSTVEDVRLALEGMLDPEITEELTATIEIRDIFKVPKIGTIGGSYVVSGKASRSDLVKVYRDDKLLHETKISSLKRFKEDVKEVASGFECGVGLEGFSDIKVGDIIETYKKVETARTLS